MDGMHLRLHGCQLEVLPIDDPRRTLYDLCCRKDLFADETFDNCIAHGKKFCRLLLCYPAILFLKWLRDFAVPRSGSSRSSRSDRRRSMTQTDLQDFVSNRAGLPRTTTLSRESGLRTLLLHLNAGERIPEHQTRGAIMVHCLNGKGAFFIADHRIELRPALLITVPAAVPHSVIAAEDEDLLLLVAVSEQVASER
jgi:quercetin dioxygenase-like cupin family protein